MRVPSVEHHARDFGGLLDLPDGRRRLGPFLLVAPLGRGGFAPVWLARETYGAAELRTAAVKLFSLDAPGESASSLSAAAYRARVIDEARALCQVEHPCIVRFYALPTDEARGVMGLAMEHVAGAALDRRLASEGRLSVAETLTVGTMIASALAAVHRAGLVHRDVKPANVVEAGGVYKLIDFGIASADLVDEPAPASSVVIYDDLPIEVGPGGFSTRGGAPTKTVPSNMGRRHAGTLGYIDPTCVATGVPATPASDLYALGATLFECLTGKLPAAAGDARRGLDDAVLEGKKPPVPLVDAAPGTPPELGRLIDALLAPERRDRPPSAERVAIELERLRGALAGLARALPPEETGPFRGLGRFEEGDRDVYFGRAGEVAAAIDLLRGRGAVALIGPSGSGKSSLARAGVLPRVAEGALAGWPRQWDTAIVSPGADARGALVAALAALDPPVAGAAAMRPEALVEALVERAVATDRGLVLLVDQLEELVTLGGGESRRWTVELLVRLGDTALPGVRVIEAVRRDLLDPLLGLGDLGKALVRGSLLVSPMSDTVWGDVIDQALSAYGYAFEDSALRTELLAELEGTASAMPLVQFALTELWHKRDRGEKQITRAGLAAIGGVAGALGRHADATVARLEQRRPGATRAAREVLLSLTTPQGTRASRAVVDLAHAGGVAGRDVLAVLEEARLVVREADGVTLAHDALVTQWARLSAWVAEVRADRVLAEELERDAARWRADETAAPWKGRRLWAAEEVLRRSAVAVSPDGAAFVRAGRRAARRGRLLAGGAAVALSALAAGGVAFYVSSVGAQKAKAVRAQLEAEHHLGVATEKTRALEEAKAQNDELLRKLADARSKEEMFALQDDVKRARAADKPAERPPAPRPDAGAVNPPPASASKPTSVPSADPARAASPAHSGPALQEKFE